MVSKWSVGFGQRGSWRKYRGHLLSRQCEQTRPRPWIWVRGQICRVVQGVWKGGPGRLTGLDIVDRCAGSCWVERLDVVYNVFCLYPSGTTPM